MMDLCDRAVYRARKTGRPARFVFPTDGQPFRATLIAPTADTIIGTVAKVLGLVVAML